MGRFPRTIERIFVIAIVAMLVAPVLGGLRPAGAQEATPAGSAEAVRGDLFDAQGLLLNGDVANAGVAVENAHTAAAPLIAAFPADGGPATRLEAGFADAT